MPSLHGFRSRSRLRCGSSSRPSTASSVDSTATTAPSPPPPVPALPDNVKLAPAPLSSSHSHSHSNSKESIRSHTPSHSPSHSQSSTPTHPSLALYPFLGNIARFSALPGEDIDLWLASVDAVAQHVGAPADAPVPLIPLLLRGDAFKRFVRMHHDTRGALSTWSAWKTHLRTEFRSAHYMDGKTDELAARGWRASETLAHYFDARRELQMIVLQGADEEELVQDMLGGLPLRQRRLVVDSLPRAQRDAPSLAALRRAMVDCEVEMRGRARLDVRDDSASRRAQSHSPGHRASKSLGQVPFPSATSTVNLVPDKATLGSSSVPDKWPVSSSVPLSPPLTPRVGVLPPPPTITVS